MSRRCLRGRVVFHVYWYDGLGDGGINLRVGVPCTRELYLIHSGTDHRGDGVTILLLP